jgi:hypothetical protein
MDRNVRPLIKVVEITVITKFFFALCLNPTCRINVIIGQIQVLFNTVTEMYTKDLQTIC